MKMKFKHFTLVTPDYIQITCDYFKISKNLLVSNFNDREVVEPRHISMYCMNKYQGLTLQEIGKLFNRHHSTIISSNKKVQGFIDIDKTYAAEVDNFKNHLNNCINE